MKLHRVHGLRDAQSDYRVLYGQTKALSSYHTDTDDICVSALQIMQMCSYASFQL